MTADGRSVRGGGPYDLRTLIRRARGEPALRREADVMGLTVCLVLMTALLAGDDQAPHTRLDVLTVVWGTTLGIALTHWFALTLSVRLVRDPSLAYRPLEMLFAQIAMAVLVASAATVAVLALPKAYDRPAARVTAAVFLALLVGVESRAGGSSWRRAVGWGLGALAVGVTISLAKWYVSR